jgi:predicted PurR-regulated permease PerM
MATAQPDAPPRGTTRPRVMVFALVVVTALAFYLCYLIARPFIPVIAWALALAIVAGPVHNWIARRVKNADVAAGLAVGAVAVAILGPVVFLLYQIGKEVAAGAKQIQDKAQDKQWLAQLEQVPWVGPKFAELREQFDLDAALDRAVKEVWENFSTVTNVVWGPVWVVVGLVLVLFTLYFFFRDRNELLGVARSVVPLSEGETDKVFDRIADTVHATVFGSLFVALIQGVMGGLMFMFLGLPSPVVWGAVMALLAVVPNLGAFVIWGPTAAILVASGQWGKAAILAVYGALAIGLIDNLLYPYLVGSRLRLHTLVVFFAMLGGLALLGAAGIVLGPVIVAVTWALVDVWRRRTAGGKPAESAVKQPGT